MKDIFKRFIEKIKTLKNPGRATVVFLHGDLGSGKTTFTKNFCEYLGLDINITSPTFTILKRYNFDLFDFNNLIHIDAYRLNSYQDLLKIKFNDYLQNKDNLIFIEWPSLISDEGLKSDIDVFFKHVDDNNKRLIEFK